jgi:hypothetical protein
VILHRINFSTGDERLGFPKIDVVGFPEVARQFRGKPSLQIQKLHVIATAEGDVAGLALPQAFAPNFESALSTLPLLPRRRYSQYRMRTHEEAADLLVVETARLEALGQLRIEFLVAEVGEIPRLALLAALDEYPEHLAEEFRRADRRRQLSPLPRELMVSDEHAKNSGASERRFANRPLDGLRLYLVSLVEDLLYPSDHVCPLSDFPGGLSIAR